MDIQKVYQANVYLDGSKSLIGKAKEIQLPEIAATTEEHSALGMLGKVDLPTGLEKMVLTFKWSGFYEDALIASANPFAETKLQIRAPLQIFGAGGAATTKPLLIEVTGSFLKATMGGLVAMTANEPSSDFSAHYVKVSLDRRELLEVDALNNIWKVDGKDLLEDFRNAMGV